MHQLGQVSARERRMERWHFALGVAAVAAVFAGSVFGITQHGWQMLVCFGVAGFLEVGRIYLYDRIWPRGRP